MAFDQNLNGKFRANKNAAPLNALRLEHPSTPGTPAIDTLTVATVALDDTAVISGITYTGMDGVSTDIDFFRQDIPDGTRESFTVRAAFIDASSPDLTALRTAIRTIIESHEVDPEIKVEYTGNPTDELVVTHTGSGTLSGLIIDQVSVGTPVRTAIP